MHYSTDPRIPPRLISIHLHCMLLLLFDDVAMVSAAVGIELAEPVVTETMRSEVKRSGVLKSVGVREEKRQISQYTRDGRR